MLSENEGPGAGGSGGACICYQWRGKQGEAGQDLGAGGSGVHLLPAEGEAGQDRAISDKGPPTLALTLILQESSHSVLSHRKAGSCTFDLRRAGAGLESCRRPLKPPVLSNPHPGQCGQGGSGNQGPAECRCGEQGARVSSS